MKSKALYMETTKIDVGKTVGEICACLQSIGASSIQTRFKEGKVSELSWTMQISGAQVAFAMPAREDPVYRKLIAKRTSNHRASVQAETRDQAARVAWRQVLRWVQAQVAMVETGMVHPAEPFIPYTMHADGTTLFENFEKRQLALSAPVEG